MLQYTNILMIGMAIMDLKWVGLIQLQKAIILQVQDEKFTFFHPESKKLMVMLDFFQT